MASLAEQLCYFTLQNPLYRKGNFIICQTSTRSFKNIVQEHRINIFHIDAAFSPLQKVSTKCAHFEVQWKAMISIYTLQTFRRGLPPDLQTFRRELPQKSIVLNLFETMLLTGDSRVSSVRSLKTIPMFQPTCGKAVVETIQLEMDTATRHGRARTAPQRF